MGQNAGELRHRVTIQHYTEGGRDEDGFPIEGGWSEYKSFGLRSRHFLLKI